MMTECYLYSSYVMITWGTVNFLSLLQTTAPYGRYVRDGWGLRVNAKLAWFVQEIPSLLIPVFLVINFDFTRIKELPGVMVIGLFILHYFHRAAIYPFRLRNSKPIPLIPFVIAFIFCAFNGLLQAGYILYHADVIFDLPYVIGTCTFVLGMCINIHSDNILRDLRSDGQQGYKIPTGGMFEYVSGANFLGEIMEWIGFAIACRTLPAVAFAIFTCCNIGPRAWHHHRFYKEKFEDYPTGRKALIPFVL